MLHKALLISVGERVRISLREIKEGRIRGKKRKERGREEIEEKGRKERREKG